MAKKIRVGVLFGGRSAEHEVSLVSAENVMDAMDKSKYEVVPIKIAKTGEFEETHLKSLDVIFPVLHGTYGEDGTIQGLLKIADLPFVGAGVLGSAIGMDKDVMKRLLRDAGVPTAKFLCLNKSCSFDFIVEKLGCPFFVKPANLGSSVGISKVKQESECQSALDKAFLYDHKILVEEFIDGREMEISILGNEHPIASLPGELIPQDEFFSYEAKYCAEKGTIYKIPAELDSFTVSRIQDLAIKTYQVLCCEGMARVDLFLKQGGEVFINELNTIPGFTTTSMYPKLWEASGIPYPELIDRLVQLGLERFHKEKQLKNSFL